MTPFRPLVLIVDDDQAICNMLSEDLTERGYSCTAVIDGKSALLKLSRQNFDAVLLDIRLPDIEGVEILSYIKQNDKNLLVIMVTAVAELDIAVESMKLGASDYLVKPIDFDRLASVMDTALAKRQTATNEFAGMDSIARGIEARFDPQAAMSKTITLKTAEVAERLGIASDTVKKWVAERSKFDSQKGELIELANTSDTGRKK